MFAKYSEHDHGSGNPIDGLHIRPAELFDIDAISAISVARDGADAEKMTAAIGGFMRRPQYGIDSIMFVAVVNAVVIGYGRCLRFAPTMEGKSTAPEGWYLMGVIVTPEYRRRGVGRELTERRIEWIGERGSAVYYFANALNRASIRMHADFGFVELTRDFSIPGVYFDGGEGILFVKHLA